MVAIGRVFQIGGVYLGRAQFFGVEGDPLPVCQAVVVHSFQVRRVDLHTLGPNYLTVAYADHRIVRAQFNQDRPLIIAKSDDVAILRRDRHCPPHPQIILQCVQDSI